MDRSKFILALSWIVFIVTLLTLITTLNKFGVITGQATTTGSTNVSIATAASISFTDDSCDFGSGVVDDGANSAHLYSNGSDNIDGSWTNNSCNGLTVSNDGNIDMNVTLSSDANAADLIGGASPDFEWIAASAGCAGSNGLATFTNVAKVSTEMCTNMTFQGAPTIDIDFHLEIPEDAPKVSEASATITALGLAI